MEVWGRVSCDSDVTASALSIFDFDDLRAGDNFRGRSDCSMFCLPHKGPLLQLQSVFQTRLLACRLVTAGPEYCMVRGSTLQFIPHLKGPHFFQAAAGLAGLYCLLKAIQFIRCHLHALSTIFADSKSLYKFNANCLHVQGIHHMEVA